MIKQNNKALNNIHEKIHYNSHFSNQENGADAIEERDDFVLSKNKQEIHKNISVKKEQSLITMENLTL